MTLLSQINRFSTNSPLTVTLRQLIKTRQNLKRLMLERRLVMAVSLNVGGGVRLIKPAKTVYVHAKHYNEDGCTAPVRGHGSLSLSHSGCYENWITSTTKRFRCF